MVMPGDKPLLSAYKAFAAFGTGSTAQTPPAKVQLGNCQQAVSACWLMCCCKAVSTIGAKNSLVKFATYRIFCRHCSGVLEGPGLWHHAICLHGLWRHRSESKA